LAGLKAVCLVATMAGKTAVNWVEKKAVLKVACSVALTVAL
jgi:hypothetical protein